MAGIKTPTLAELGSMALMNPVQHQLVKADVDNNHRALTGKPMAYSGGDADAQGYVPEDAFPTNHPLPVPEPEIVRQNLQRDLETLRKGTPPDYSGYTKNELFAMFKELREKYRQGMLSHTQMWQPTHAHIQQYMAHEEANGLIGRALTNIHRILDFDDEGFSLESLRPTEAAPVNLRMFSKGFDELRFTDETERALRERDLDEETYAAFVHMKVATTSEKLIQRKLGIDQVTLEACKDRLKKELAKYRDEEAGQEPNGQTEPEPPSLEVAEPVILEELARNGESGTHFHDLAELLQCSQKDTRHILRLLREQGKVKGVPGNTALYRLNTDPVSA